MSLSPPDDLVFLPARYIGTHRTYLKHNGAWDYVTPDGAPFPEKQFSAQTADGRVSTLTVYALAPGDVLMMPEAELLGQTFLSDPTSAWADLALGSGWRTLTEHAGMTQEELADTRFLGPYGRYWYYRFEAGRSDFEPVDAPSAEPPVDGAALPRQRKVRRARTAAAKLAADAAAQRASGESLPAAITSSTTIDPAASSAAADDAAPPAEQE